MVDLEKPFQDKIHNQKDLEIQSLVETNAKLRWLIGDLKIKINTLFSNMELDFPDALSHNENIINSIKELLK